MSKEKSDYINRIIKNDENALTELYDKYYGSFNAFFKKYGLDSSEIPDAYQDTMIALYQNIHHGKLKILDGSLKTYIWGIGKHKVIDMVRKKALKVPEIELEEVESIVIEDSELNNHQKLLHKHFKELGESCKQILKYFYYEGLTIDEIVSISEYKDANTVKSTKSRCIKQLKSLINKG